MIPARGFQTRFDRPVLVGHLASGVVLLLFLAALGAWPLAIVGAAYVVAVSLFLGAVYAGERSRGQELLAWVTPWLLAIAVWWLVLLGVDSGGSSSPLLGSLWAAVVVATPCYLGWQLLALAVRQFLAWRRAVSAPGPAARPH